MRLAGIVFILLSSFATGKLLEREASGGVRELSAFISFLKTLRTRLECYLESPEHVAADYSDPILEKIGFLEAITHGKSLHASYLEARGALSISNEADKLLGDLFSQFGKGYLSNELRAIDGTLGALLACLDSESKCSSARARALKITAPTLGIGLVILLF